MLFSDHSFFSLHSCYSKAAWSIEADYSLEDVPDPFIMDTPSQTPSDFLEHFRFSMKPGQPEDMLANGVGWLILSPRVASVFKTVCQKDEIELIALGRRHDLPEETAGYCLLGVKRLVRCVDFSRSEILWSLADPKARHILAFRKCVIRKEAIPATASCFFIAEYPGFPVLGERLAAEVIGLNPSGLRLKELLTS